MLREAFFLCPASFGNVTETMWINLSLMEVSHVLEIETRGLYMDTLLYLFNVYLMARLGFYKR